MRKPQTESKRLIITWKHTQPPYFRRKQIKTSTSLYLKLPQIWDTGNTNYRWPAEKGHSDVTLVGHVKWQPLRGARGCTLTVRRGQRLRPQTPPRVRACVPKVTCMGSHQETLCRCSKQWSGATIWHEHFPWHMWGEKQTKERLKCIFLC